MAGVGWATRHRGLILAAAVLAPLLASALMSTLRDNLENTNAALVLVLLVVAAASTGIRLAGVFAALSSAVWLDFFLTAPYLAFAIIDRADLVAARRRIAQLEAERGEVSGSRGQ